ncbi:helix-turn-helix domain-containing protein, partial [Escherichia coli]|uniref:helix-turn-helix domain-containing protein n=1 Tax=Escherichia coli TaxID=562 RepID=UPI0021E06F8D
FVYNWALAQRHEAWKTEKKNISFIKASAAMTKLKASQENKWLNEVSSISLQQSLRNLDAAFLLFFKRKNSYPSFKSKKSGGSARF